MSKKNGIADAVKSLQKHYVQRYQKDGHPHFLMVMKPDDMKTWYVLFLNMEGSYAGGEFLMKLEAPDNYPFSPPVFTFMTPNNRFKTDGKPCVDMGHYHSNNWSPQTGMYGFTVQIYYALNMPMSDLGGGIGIYTAKEQSDEQKVACAKASIEFNKKNYSDVINLFEEERLRNDEKESKKKKPIKTQKSKTISKDDDDSVSSLSMPDSEDELSEDIAPKSTKSKKPVKSIKSIKPQKSKSKKISEEDDSLSSLSVPDSEDLLSEESPPKKSSKKKDSKKETSKEPKESSKTKEQKTKIKK